jgi:hypothetical protein
MILENLTGGLLIGISLLCFFVATRMFDSGDAEEGSCLVAFAFGLVSTFVGGYILIWNAAILPIYNWIHVNLPQEGMYTSAYAFALTFIPFLCVLIGWIGIWIYVFAHIKPDEKSKA